MEYIGLVCWIVGLTAFVVWGQSFNKRSYDIMSKRNMFFAFSAVLVFISLASLQVNGVNKGLDFTGGSIIEAGVYEMKTPPDINAALADVKLSNGAKLGAVSTQVGTEMVEDLKPEEGQKTEYQKIIVRLTLEGGVALEPAQTQEVLAHLKDKFGEFKELRTASIGPTISGELTNNAIKAVVLALLLQLVYIFFRFGNQIRYGLAADVALVHDVIIMIGFYSFAGREVDSAFIAALLTIVGYSVMDSVVIFDRIRENLNDWWDEHGDDGEVPYQAVVNDSVNQTMTRSINTTLTTLVTLLAIYYFGGSTLQNFAFALLVGILSGAYSSICVASPLLVSINEKYPAQPPKNGGAWYDDDEIVPEDYMDDAPKALGAAARTQTAPPISDSEVEDEVPRSKGGRRRSRGKRS